MKRSFKLQKLPLEDLLNIFIELYESGVDFVDLSSDNSDPNQDKLVIFTREGYINPDYYNEQRLSQFEIEEDTPHKTSIIETKKLSDEDLNNLL